MSMLLDHAEFNIDIPPRRLRKGADLTWVMDDSSRGFPVHARQADIQTGLKEEFALCRSEIHFCIDGGVRGKTQLPLCSSSGHGADKQIAASHAVFASQPEKVANVIDEAAKSLSR